MRRRRTYRDDWIYKVQCVYCGRTVHLLGAALNSAPVQCPCASSLGGSIGDRTRWRILEMGGFTALPPAYGQPIVTDEKTARRSGP